MSSYSQDIFETIAVDGHFHFAPRSSEICVARGHSFSFLHIFSPFGYL